MSRKEKLGKDGSLLSQALRGLVEESNLLDLEEWASLLQVMSGRVPLWLNDRELPSPEHLNRIWDLVQQHSRVPEAILEEFRKVIALPAASVTPFADQLRREPTIGHYMLRPMRVALLRTLATLDAETQKRMLLETAEKCRQLRDGDTDS